MSDIYDDTLLEYFGYSELKPLQKAIIKTVLVEELDVLGILATGYGKSICYQLPFLVLGQTKTVIVVSPLIALMEDQKASLEKRGIPVICMNSNMTVSVKNYEKEQLLSGQNKIVYMTPEYLVTCEDFLIALWNCDRLAFVAIDESHCVSSWGSDFRPEYKSLSCLKEWIPDLNIMALTATATANVRKDIITTLGMKKYTEYVSSFDRPNLYIECKTKTSDIKYDLGDLVKEFNNKFCIVYVRTREMTETVAKTLKLLGIDAYAYHAGINSKIRHEIQQNFIAGKCGINGCYCCTSPATTSATTSATPEVAA